MSDENGNETVDECERLVWQASADYIVARVLEDECILYLEAYQDAVDREGKGEALPGEVSFAYARCQTENARLLQAQLKLQSLDPELLRKVKRIVEASRKSESEE